MATLNQTVSSPHEIPTRLLTARPRKNTVRLLSAILLLSLLGSIFVFVFASILSSETHSIMRDAQGRWVIFRHSPGTGVLSVAFSPDGKLLASGDNKGVVNVWKPSEPQFIKVLNDHRAPVYAIAFHASEKLFCTGDLDGLIYLYELPSFRLITCLHEHNGCIRSLIFSPDGKRLVSASSDGSVRLWDLVTHKSVHTFAIADKIFGFTMASLNSKEQVVALEGVGKIDLLRLSDLTLIEQKPCGANRIVTNSLSSGVSFFATVDQEGLVTVWDTNSLAPRMELRPGPRLIPSVTVSPDASLLAYTAEINPRDDKIVYLYNLKTKQKKDLKFESDVVRVLAFSPNGQFISLSCSDGQLLLCKSHRFDD